MALLRAILLLGLAACYEPVLSDCTVSCISDEECAGGQACNEDWCTREGVTCQGDPPLPITGDAGVSEDSATPPPDGPAPGDASLPTPDAGPNQGMLRIKISDQGFVHVSGQTTCDSQVAPGNSCSYVVNLGTPVTLEAEPHAGRYFEKWEDACAGQPAVCTIIPLAAETKVEARFKKLD